MPKLNMYTMSSLMSKVGKFKLSLTSAAERGGMADWTRSKLKVRVRCSVKCLVWGCRELTRWTVWCMH